MNYSLLRGLWKALLQIIVFGLPIGLTALETMPQTSVYLDLTVGGALSLFINWLKIRIKQSQ